MDTDVRLNLYRRLSNLSQKTELETMSEEIRDRFGSPPQEVRNLLSLMSLRLLLKNTGISRLDVGSDWLAVTLSPDRKREPKRLVERVNNEPQRFRFLSANKLRVHVGTLSPSEDLSKLENAIKELSLS
jgi:transcription-repair coupling factor (superfamily II helicase)